MKFLLIPSNWKWFRKWYGGQWFYNRYWYDAGRVIIYQWERHDTNQTGGSYCTLRKKDYGIKNSPKWVNFFCNL